MEKLSPKCAQLLLRNKYTVFTMGGTVALWSVNKKFSGELQCCSYVCARASIEGEGVVFQGWVSQNYLRICHKIYIMIILISPFSYENHILLKSKTFQ